MHPYSTKFRKISQKYKKDVIDPLIADSKCRLIGYALLEGLDLLRIKGYAQSVVGGKPNDPDWDKYKDHAGYHVFKQISVFIHTLNVLDSLPQTKSVAGGVQSRDLVAAHLAAVYHDIGKAWTLSQKIFTHFDDSIVSMRNILMERGLYYDIIEDDYACQILEIAERAIECAHTQTEEEPCTDKAAIIFSRAHDQAREAEYMRYFDFLDSCGDMDGKGPYCVLPTATENAESVVIKTPESIVFPASLVPALINELINRTNVMDPYTDGEFFRAFTDDQIPDTLMVSTDLLHDVAFELLLHNDRIPSYTEQDLVHQRATLGALDALRMYEYVDFNLLPPGEMGLFISVDFGKPNPQSSKYYEYVPIRIKSIDSRMRLRIEESHKRRNSQIDKIIDVKFHV